jgi:hypothetical protein
VHVGDGGVGFVSRPCGQPIVVLMVDDADDAELASSLAGEESVAATDLDGSWSAQVDGARLIVEFRLIRRDGEWERRWTCTNPGGGVLNAISAGFHHVAIVPLVGDLGEFVREGVRGAVVIEAQASGAVTAARELLALSSVG